jgi:hypothetical protein
VQSFLCLLYLIFVRGVKEGFVCFSRGGSVGLLHSRLVEFLQLNSVYDMMCMYFGLGRARDQ